MDTSDPRVIGIFAHAKACREAVWGEESRPPLPHELKDLSGIDLSGANLEDADLAGAKLEGANLTGASLYRAKLYTANLTGADLTDANLLGANLNAAQFIGAKLSGADLTGADLGGAGLGFADLTDAKITQDQLNSGGYANVPQDGYPKEVAEKVILFHTPEANFWKQKAKKRLVVELRADGKLHIKTPIFRY